MNKPKVINSVARRNMERKKSTIFCGCIFCLVDKKAHVGPRNQ
ncbi:hypothetical protein [Pseudoalteromonas luteoviolacea]|nr:hypothetical protein [Pseudoalteromonas luteoviolacea]